jgi:hypothetical protein
MLALVNVRHVFAIFAARNNQMLANAGVSLAFNATICIKGVFTGFVCCIDDADYAKDEVADGSRVCFHGKSEDDVAYNANAGADGSRVWFHGKRPDVVMWRLTKTCKGARNDCAIATDIISSSVISPPPPP